ncbi:MAG: hypothetical protein VKK43_11425 [Synechococcaceae cyanobacterium]|nr:hypothetical protein [Synechococcaceae cyanobacterium]
MARSSDLIGIWSTSVPGGVVQDSGLTGSRAGDLFLYRDNTYVWYQSNGIDGVKRGSWSSTTDPDYPLILDDPYERLRWRLRFQRSGDDSSIYIVPIGSSGNSQYTWYVGERIQSLPGATIFDSEINPGTPRPSRSIAGLVNVIVGTEPQTDSIGYTINFPRDDYYTPLSRLAINESAALIIEGRFDRVGDSDGYDLDFLGNLTLQEQQQLFTDFYFILSISPGARISNVSKTGGQVEDSLTRAVLPANSPYSQSSGYTSYFFPGSSFGGGNPTFTIEQQTPGTDSYTAFLAFYRYGGSVNSTASRGIWKPVGADNDYYAELGRVGSVSLLRNGLGYAIEQNNVFLQILYNGNYVNSSNGWQVIAACASNDGGYFLYWRNLADSSYERWLLNASGDYVTGSSLSLVQLFGEESVLNLDLSGDGVIGQVLTAGTPVYRFYKNEVHFYTNSVAERNSVIANSYAAGVTYTKLSSNPSGYDPITGGWGYRYEGIAYQALVIQGNALYRFYSPGKSYHFMTTSSAEALQVVRNSVGSSYDLTNAAGKPLLSGGWGYQYEGTSYNVSTTLQPDIDTPVYRFFNVKKGVHFYSSSLDEVRTVITNSVGAQYANDLNAAQAGPPLLANGWQYQFEGVAWYV